MLGRSERARNEPAPALGPWMIWTARLARRTRAPCRTRDRPIAPGAIQIQGEILPVRGATGAACRSGMGGGGQLPLSPARSEEHTSELKSLMRISYAVFCLKKKNKKTKTYTHITN